MSRQAELAKQTKAIEQQNQMIEGQAESARAAAVGQIRNRVSLRDAWLMRTFGGKNRAGTVVGVSSSGAGTPNQPQGLFQSLFAGAAARRDARQQRRQDFMASQRQSGRGLLSGLFGHWVRR